MSFLAPLMLWGSLAAAIPIALHFFYRSRYHTVPWAAMKFLLTSIEQTSRRIRFQELLLLMLRVAMLVLLALALARPSLKGAGRGGDAVDAVVVIDNSMSMTAASGVVPPGTTTDPYLVALRSFARPDGTVTCFDRARAAAIAIVEGLPPQSTVQVVAATDRATLLGPRVPSRLDQARQLIEEMTPTHLSTDFQPAVRLAAELVERGPSPGKEIYLVSDMQRRGWQVRQGDLTELLTNLREKAEIHLVHCVPSEGVNVAVVGVTPQTTLRPGERTDFAVLIRHTGKRTARNLTVSLEIDGKSDGKDTQALPELAPGQTRAVILSALINKPGRHVLTATVGPDDLEGDNRFDLVLQVAEHPGILLVDGAPNDRDPSRAASFYLQHALGQLPVTVVPASRAAPRDLGSKELCILVNTRLEAASADEAAQAKPATGSPLSSDFIRSLGPFVGDGGGLLIFAGNQVEPARYNAWLYDRLPLLPYKIGKEEKTTQDKPWSVDRGSALTQPFARFRNESGYTSIDRIETRRLFSLDVPAKATDAADSQVLLRYHGGLPAVASRRKAGAGEVMFFTTSVSDPAWSDWVISPGFVPFVQIAVNHLLQGRPQELNRVAGQSLVWQAPSTEANLAFDLVDPSGERSRIGFAESVGGRPTVLSPDVSRAGLYRIVAAGMDITEATPVFAVTPDLTETEDLACLSPGEIDTQLGFTAIHTTAGDVAVDFSEADRLSREWTPWLLLTLLAFVGFEMFLAWFCDQAPGGAPAPAMQ